MLHEKKMVSLTHATTLLYIMFIIYPPFDSPFAQTVKIVDASFLARVTRSFIMLDSADLCLMICFEASWIQK